MRTTTRSALRNCVGRLTGARVLAVLTLAMLLNAPDAAVACTCATSPSPCASVDAGTPIFVGTVLSIAPVETSATGSGPATRDVAVRIAAKDVLNGPGAPDDTVTVMTPADGAACGYPFEVGTEYLVYAWSRGTTLFTGACTRTAPTTAAVEQLALLRELKAGAPVTRLMGTFALLAMTSGSNGMGLAPLRPESGTLVTARGADDVTHETALDGNGQFLFRGLPPGDYTLAADLPGMSPVFSSSRVTLDRCFADTFIMLSFIGMEGKASTRTGAPAKDVPITIATVDSAGRPMSAAFSTSETTDDDGTGK